MGLGVLVVAVAIAVALAASRPALLPATSPSPGSTTPAAPPTAHPLSAQFPDLGVFPVLAAGSIWAPNWDTGDVVRIDTATNQVVATINVGERPHAMAVQDGADGIRVWVSGRDDEGWAVMAIDPERNVVVDRIHVGDQGWAMAIVGDTMWLTSFESSRLLRIDLATREVVNEIRLGNALGVAADEQGAWVALGASGQLAHVRASDNDVTFVHTGAETTAMPIIVGSEVWVTTLYDGRVLIVSRDTSEVISEIALHFPSGIAQQDSRIWIADGAIDDPATFDRALAFDAGTHQLITEVPLTGLAVDRSIVPDGNTLWVVGNGLMRVDL
jgi:YVTN family beta-propeller protein